ncbi:MAG: ADP-ribosylglycohydrolase family protein [Candidatus Margulisbacteria bacterium]|jgi:hypothetical protein|nr:ADP-ribosylglycohydrolase family protein [Candidatus Margulisiibacteriota bacterium]
MTTTRVSSNRPNVLSAFRGCLLAQAAAAYQGTKHNPRFLEDGHWSWPHELYYTQFIVRGYSRAKGQLNLPAMREAIELGLEFELGRKKTIVPPCDLFADAEMQFRQLEDRHRGAQVIREIRPHKDKREWIGGPGFAAHASAIGLVNRNNIPRIFEDSMGIGQISHQEAKNALAGGIVTALAIALAVTEGNQPAAIVARLMATLRLDETAGAIPQKLMNKLTLVEKSLRRKVDATQGISELRSKPRKTVVDVLPGAIFAALNGARTLGGLLGPLKIYGNYKAGMIAASIWGAMHGEGAVSPGYLQGLEGHECLRDNADELYRVTTSSSV